MTLNSTMKKINTLRVAELFAGVGGFRLGLDRVRVKNKKAFETVWSNQYEPSKKIQIANDVYVNKFGRNNHCEEDIETVIKDFPNIINDHDVLVGGFPCQDYSVAATLKTSGGIEGKKGVLWWSINDFLEHFQNERNSPTPYLVLENVNRLLVSPAKRRGKDFAIMLSCLNRLGYAVEWRVINAADYGLPQRRRRVFMVGYHKNSNIYKTLSSSSSSEIINSEGVLENAFSSRAVGEIQEFKIDSDPKKVSDTFNIEGGKSQFLNSGFMINGVVASQKLDPNYNGKYAVLRDIIDDDNDNIPEEFFINKKDLKKWNELKGSKSIEKESNGFKYTFKEGSMVWPDPLDKPSRTIITGEGGNSPSRFKHIIKVGSKHRRLTPKELDMLSDFPEDWTKYGLRSEPDKNSSFEYELSPNQRAFLIGNALVVGIVERIGKALFQKHSELE